jgi:hypothetical protein
MYQVLKKSSGCKIWQLYAINMVNTDVFYTAVQPRRQLWTSYSPPWELEISHGQHFLFNIFYMTFKIYYLKLSPTTITYCGTKMKSEAGPSPRNRLSQPPPWLSSQDHLLTRPLLMPVAQKLCRCEYGVFMTRKCLFSNITSQRNRLLLFAMHLAMHILTGNTE